MEALDPTSKQQAQAQDKAKKLMKSLGIDKDVKLSQHELMVASNLVEPAAMSHKWQDIAGLDSVVQELRDTVILPIQKR